MIINRKGRPQCVEQVYAKLVGGTQASKIESECRTTTTTTTNFRQKKSSFIPGR
jgi:hypothetical protein